MYKSLLEMQIGRLILAMNSIDLMTYHCHRVLTQRAPREAWMNKSLADRLKFLVKGTDADSAFQSRLRNLLSEANAIRNLRNMIAHAWIALDAQASFIPGEPSKWVLIAKDHEPMTLEDLIIAVKRCEHMSDQISENIAVIELERMRERDQRLQAQGKGPTL